MVRAHLPASPLFSVSGREPRAGNFGIRGPPAGMVRAHLPASPLFSVSGREPQAGAGRLFQGAVCSPLPANPCGSVPGSKFFTQIPRRRPVPAGFSKARFAPPSPRALAAPSRGANSSHKFRAAGRGRAAFPWRGLLPAPRKPLQLRSGEQILHINPAPTPESGRLSKARFAPRSSLALAAPFRGANSSHKFRAASPYPAVQSTHRPAPAHKKHLAGLSARCFPLLNSAPQVPVPRGTFN